MTNITHKNTSLRKAIASAILKVSNAETIVAIENKTVPKGDVLSFARAAGLLAIKNTSSVIPDCHPLPIEYAAINFEFAGLNIHIKVEVQTVYKTGVEVEAMHGASIVALTMYDMLKPIDKGIEIHSIKLDEKKGGKSDYSDRPKQDIKTAVVVCSDSIAAGDKVDFAGKVIMEKLKNFNLPTDHYSIIADEQDQIQAQTLMLCEQGFRLIIFTGGTGLSKRDVTPEAIAPLLHREIPGIMEAARVYGQHLTPYAMLSRGIAGFRGDSLILTLPGSTRGAAETMDALFPSILHIFKVSEGMRHDA